MSQTEFYHEKNSFFLNFRKRKMRKKIQHYLYISHYFPFFVQKILLLVVMNNSTRTITFFYKTT
jgi:hypothetical protein